MRAGMKRIIAGAIVGGLEAVVILFFMIRILLPGNLGDEKNHRFNVPGSTEVVVEDSGRYYLWNDYKTVYEGKDFNQSKHLPKGTAITIINKETGTPYDFVHETIYKTSGSESATSIGYIEINTPATVEIDVQGGNEERVFSFFKYDFFKTFYLIAAVIGISMILGPLSLVLLISGFVGMVRANKKHNQTGGTDP